MTEIEDLLTQYNVDSRNTKLRDYYEADNLWRTLRIERDENSHSAFLAWLLNKDALQHNGPFFNFLNLMIRRKVGDEETDYKELKKAVLMGRLQLRSVHFSVEKVISKLSSIRFNDRIDIFGDCEISGVGNYTKLEIIVENKIDSQEGKYKIKDKFANLSEEENHYKDLMQTGRYYYACSKEDGLRKAPFDGNQTIQLFVFLTAKEQDPSNPHFITISYQDIVDFVLEPYLNRDDIDTHTSMAINEYLRILGNPINNSTTMATTSEEKELLTEFYKNNEDLFKRALEVMRDNAESEEEANNFVAMLDSMKKSKARRFFRIKDSDKEYKMYEVVAEFVKYLRKKGLSFESIEETIKNYSKEGICHISANKEKVRRSEKCFVSDYEGQPFYVTKEWGRGLQGRNFDGLMAGINRDYPDFQILEKE